MESTALNWRFRAGRGGSTSEVGNDRGRTHISTCTQGVYLRPARNAISGAITDLLFDPCSTGAAAHYASEAMSVRTMATTLVSGAPDAVNGLVFDCRLGVCDRCGTGEAPAGLDGV